MLQYKIQLTTNTFRIKTNNNNKLSILQQKVELKRKKEDSRDKFYKYPGVEKVKYIYNLFDLHCLKNIYAY